jgi:hypothetical protein
VARRTGAQRAERLSQEQRLLFVNKKKQKNFAPLGHAGFSATGPKEQKFLRRFFKKRQLFLS